MMELIFAYIVTIAFILISILAIAWIIRTSISYKFNDLTDVILFALLMLGTILVICGIIYLIDLLISIPDKIK